MGNRRLLRLRRSAWESAENSAGERGDLSYRVNGPPQLWDVGKWPTPVPELLFLGDGSRSLPRLLPVWCSLELWNKYQESDFLGGWGCPASCERYRCSHFHKEIGRRVHVKCLDFLQGMLLAVIIIIIFLHLFMKITKCCFPYHGSCNCHGN